MNNGAGFIVEQMRLIVSTIQPYSQYATIISVDTDKFTCSVQMNLNSKLIYNDVPLSAFGKNGFVVIPEINSTVVVCFFDANNCCVVQTSDISQYQIKNKDLELKTMLLNLADAILNAQFKHSQGPTLPQGLIDPSPINQFKQDVNKLFL